MTNRILLTGASGFVGTYVRQAIKRELPDAIVIGVGAKADLPSDGHVVPLDLTAREATDALVAEVKPDAVVHLAGQASVARAERDQVDLTWAVNAGGTINLATAIARHAPDATVLFASSAEVYGASFLRSPVGETSPLMPLNAYAKSKALAERIFADILPSTARLVVARPFNHTGPGQREDFVLPSFAGQIARIEAGTQPPRMAVGNLEVIRDFLDVRDVADAYVKLLVAASHLPPRFVVNIASGRPLPLRDLVEIMTAHARVTFEIVVDPSRVRPIDVPVAYGEPALLRAVTGWSPATAIEVTCADLLTAARASLSRG